MFYDDGESRLRDPQRVIVWKTKYDYLDGNKRILSHDGKTASIIMIPKFNGNILQELGEIGGLKGKALLDYEQIKKKEV